MNTLRVPAAHAAAIVLIALMGTALTGCEQAKTEVAATPLARPVSYITLQQRDPSLRSLVAGSVESWKKELIGFQVGGRVRSVREPGLSVEGRLVSETGDVLTPGTVLGSMDNERYRLRVEEARARVQGVKAQAQAIRTEIEQTIPSQLREAQAEWDRAKTEYGRQLRLKQRGAGAQQQVDATRAQFRAADARMDQLRAQREEGKARLAAVQAQVTQAREALHQAETDLEDTRIHSPFNGQISKVHVIPGGYVERGQPVVTVQMMDPMKVQVAVGPSVDRNVNFNDVMKVYVDGADEPLDGWVWNKDAVADAATRTFTVTLLVRNRRIETGLPPGLQGKRFHRTANLWNLEAEHGDRKAPFFTNVQTLHRDDQGPFVWKAEGVTIPDLRRDFEPVLRVKKVRVRPGNRRVRFLQVFTFVELDALGGLDPATDLLVPSLPADTQDGDTVFLSRTQWLMRPGQLVGVDLEHGRAPPGFYVPAQSVVKEGGEHHVYVVADQADGAEQARRVAVQPGVNVGTFQAIAPAGDHELARGMKLIVGGAHYLRDGDRVNAFDELEDML